MMTGFIDCLASLRWWVAGDHFSGSSGSVIAGHVRLEHLPRGEAFDAHRHGAFHHVHPLRGMLARYAIVVHRNYFVFEQAKEMLHVLFVLVTFPRRERDRPSVLASVSLGPPAIQRPQLGHPVQRDRKSVV